MKIALAVFVKTPGLSPIKTRLAKSTSVNFASEFYKQSIVCTSLFLKSLQKKLYDLDLFWAIAEEQGLTSEYWKDFAKVSQGEGNLGMRLNKVYSDLIEKYDAVFFMGADSPHLSSVYIGKMVNLFLKNHQDDFLMGNTSDGGYYFFGGKKPIFHSVWLNVRYSTIHTANDFSANLKPYGNVFFINEDFDIDEKNDFNKYLSSKFSLDGLLEEQINFINSIKTLDGF